MVISDVVSAWIAVSQGDDDINNDLADLQAILEHVPVGMVIVAQDDGRILYANHEAAETMAIPRDGITVDHLKEIARQIALDGSDLPFSELATTRARQTGEPTRGTVGMEYTDGDVRWFAVRAMPITLPDGTAVVITSFMGITEVIAAQRQQAEYLELQSQFLANVSHEMRTPISIAGGHAELLAEDWITDEATRKQAVISIHRATKRLRWLVENVLWLHKLEHGVDIPVAPFDISATIAEVVEDMQLAAEMGNVLLTCAEISSLVLTGSEPLVWLAVANLIGNAIKFTKGGSVSVAVEVRPGEARVRVIDTGIGISTKDQAIIFDKFRQVDGSDTRKYGGTGIGLYFVKLVAGFHQGHVSVESEPGKGSTFRLHLPLEDTA